MNEIQHDREQESAAIGQSLIMDAAAWCGLPETATSRQIDSAIYDGTDCGASIHFTEFGVVVHTIVEGSDAEFSREYRPGPDYTRDHFHAWLGASLDEINDLAIEAWKEANE